MNPASAAHSGPLHLLRQFADRATGALSYLLGCGESHEAIMIDPVLDDLPLYLGVLGELDLNLTFVLDTHIHADHVTAAAALREATGACVGVSRLAGARGANLLLEGGDRLNAGTLALEAVATPGHTAHCLTYRWQDRLFTGDSLLIGGAGSTDEPGGDAGRLYDSVTQLLLPLADETLIYPAHDHQGRRVGCVGEERRQNPAFAGVSRDEFVSRRAQETPPKLPQKAACIAANLCCGVAH